MGLRRPAIRDARRRRMEVMLHILSIVAVAAALSAPQAGIVANAPVAVNACAVTDLVSPAWGADLAPPISSRMLQLTFTNTADAVATQVSFDVVHDGTHTTVTDRGRFTKNVPIEHFFDDYTGAFGGGDASCSVKAITFADGRRWSTPG
jgi:hypothetical protein